MAKLQTLTNNVLKELLQKYELDTNGKKTEMVVRLTEYLGTDEIPDTVLNEININRNNNIQKQIDTMKIMIENLAKIVSERQPVVETRDITITSDTENSNISENQPERRQKEVTRYNIQEIMAMLPEFNAKNGSFTSQQFIKKIETLRSVYGWAEEALLYAVQGKLFGHAKTWVDAQNIFKSWNEFSKALVADFSCETTMADEHLALATTRQGKTENVVDYYYKMISKGRRAEMDDQSIIRHIINGLADENIKRTCNANQFSTCTQLLQAINGMETAIFSTRIQTEHNYRSNDKNIQKFDEKSNVNSGQKGVICYNCGGSGHISRNCSQPQKRERCTCCDKIHRRGQTTCESSVRRIEIKKKINNIFERSVIIAGTECSAYIDTGSECHLIRNSIINKLQLQPESCGVELSGLWGGKCLAKEKVKAKVQIDELEIEDMFLVVEDDVLSTDLLLGRSLFEHNGVTIQITSEGFTLNVQKRVMCTNVKLLKNSTDSVEMITEVEHLETKDKIHELKEEFDDIFSSGLNNLGRTDLIEMNIELTTNDVVRYKPYPKSRKRKRYSSVYSADKLKPWCELFKDDFDNENDKFYDEVDEVATMRMAEL